MFSLPDAPKITLNSYARTRRSQKTQRNQFLLFLSLSSASNGVKRCNKTLFVTQLLTINAIAAIVITLSSYTQQELN